MNIDFSAVPYPAGVMLKAALVGVVAIVIASLLREPIRQKSMAVVLGVAAGAYLDGGFEMWEFPFAIAVAVCAYKGLTWYPAIGIGWLLHTGWDILHHAAGEPMIGFLPYSSLECAVTDALLAVWFFAHAPDVTKPMRAWLQPEAAASDGRTK